MAISSRFVCTWLSLCFLPGRRGVSGGRGETPVPSRALWGVSALLRPSNGGGSAGSGSGGDRGGCVAQGGTEAGAGARGAPRPTHPRTEAVQAAGIVGGQTE